MTFQVATGLSPYPYPGLRAFHKSEADIFFGRDQQIDQLLAKLDQHRFLAVLGPSGCGKSSLIRAGLIPALETGFMASVGYRWRTTAMRPGDSPLANLAEALFEDRICHAEHDVIQDELAFLRATLNRGPLGLIEALKERGFPDDENLLVLVDQFEELFRFERHGGRSESRAFVDLLLASAAHPGVPVYVVITMRSEFLGQCPLFRGLPEAMNDSQFLTPRLTRDQIRDTISGPASMFNTEIEPEVVTRILNSMGTDPDQLPLMQHLLMRMWRRAALEMVYESPGGGEDDEDSRRTWDTLCGMEDVEFPRIVLTSVEYEKSGGLSRALHNHAEKTFKTGLASDQQRRLAEIVFRHLTEINQDGHTIRRPATMAEICEAAKIDVNDPQQFKQLADVIEAFRAEGRSFLMPPSDEPLTLATRLDISHETLIRQWERLRTWTVKEDRFRKIAREVHTKAKRWKDGGQQEDFLLTGVDLARAQEWQEQVGCDETSTQTEPWVLMFLDESRKQRDRGEREKQRAKYAGILQVLAGAVGVLALVALAMAGWAWHEQHKASATVARQTLEKAARLMTDGDLTGSMLWIHDALEQDRKLGLSERQQLHSVRLGAGMSQLARLENFWGLPEYDATYFVPSPNGRLVMVAAGPMSSDKSGNQEGGAWIWNLGDSSGQPSAHQVPWLKLPHDYSVRHASWSPDGRFVITASAAARGFEGEVLLWDIERQHAAQRTGGRASMRLSVEKGRGVWTAFSDASGSDDAFALAVVECVHKRHRVYCWRFDQRRAGPVAAESAKAATPRLVQEIDGTVKWAGFRPSVVKQSGGIEQAAVAPCVVIAGIRQDEQGFVEAYDLPVGNDWLTSAPDNTTAVPSPVRRWKHFAAVNWVALSPDGARVATACQNQLRVFSWDHSESIWAKTHGDNVGHIAFSPDGQLVVSASQDNTAQIWNAEDGAWNCVLRHDRWVNWSQFSPDGRRVLTAGRDQLVKIWDVATRTLVVPPLNHAGAVQQAYFTPDGTRVLTRSWNLVRRWNLDTGNPPPSIFQGDPLVQASDRSDWKMKCSENGRCLALISHDAEDRWQLRVDNLANRQTFAAQLPYRMDDLWVDGEGRFLLACGRSSEDAPAEAWLYDCLGPGDQKPVQLQLPKTLQQRPFKLAAFLHFGEQCVLVTVGDSVRKEATSANQNLRIVKETRCAVQTWDVKSGTQLAKAMDTDTVGEASFLAVSPDFERRARLALLTVYVDQADAAGTVVVWDLRPASDAAGLPSIASDTATVIDQSDGSPVHAAFDRDAKRLLTTANANEDRAFLWDLAQPKIAVKLVELRHTSDITFVGFSNETDHQKYLVTCSYDNTARIWVNPRTRAETSGEGNAGQCVAVLQHDKRVNHASFFCAGSETLVATSSQDGSTRVWDAQTGELVALFRASGNVERATFVPDDADRAPRLVRLLCNDGAVRGVRVGEWSMVPLQSEHEVCLPLIAARQRSGQASLKPVEKFDRLLARGSEKSEQEILDFDRMLSIAETYHEAFQAVGEPAPRRHLRQAEEAELRGQWFAAQWHLGRILAESPDDVPVLRRRSRAYVETNRWGPALTDLDRIIAQDAATWFDWQLAGDAHRALQRWDMAATAYQRALEGNPESVSLLSRCVEAAAESADWTTVESSLMRLAERQPGDHEVLTQLATVQLARGDQEAYAESCRGLVERFAKTTDPQIANAVSWTCSLSEQPVNPEAALRLAETARLSDPNSDRYAYTLAAASYRLGKYKDAYDLLEQVRQMRTANISTATDGALRQSTKPASPPVGQFPVPVPLEADAAQLYQPSTGSVWDWLYLAMVQSELGKPDEAARSLDVAERWFAERGPAADAATGQQAGVSETGPYDLSLIPWPRRLELKILLEQARRLVKR